MSNKRKKYSAGFKAKVALAAIRNEETTANSRYLTFHWHRGNGVKRVVCAAGI